MSNDSVIGYIVVGRVGDTVMQTLEHSILHDDIEWARDVARGLQAHADATGDITRYAVHAVLAEVTE